MFEPDPEQVKLFDELGLTLLPKADAAAFALAVVQGERERGGIAWDQRKWAGSHPCGTSVCVAGALMLSAGCEGNVSELNVYAGTVGRVALGLTVDQANWLFAGTRYGDEIVTVLTAIAEGREPLWPCDQPQHESEMV